MKEEIRRIMNLVKEGKLSPEDAAELIEAFEDAPVEEATATGDQPGAAEETSGTEEQPKEDPFGKLIGSIEKIGKDVAKGVNWSEIAEQVRQGVGKGVESIKAAAEEAKKSGKPWSVIFGIEADKVVELPLAIPKGKSLRIENASGDISITGGHEVGAARFDATFRAMSEEDAKAAAEQYVPIIEENDQFIVIRQPDIHNLSVDLSIKVPEGVPVEIRHASGDISIFGTKAACRIAGSSGDITLGNLEGTVEVNVSSGDIRVEHSGASLLTVENKAGDIDLESVTGVVNVRTSSGDVRITECTARTVSVEAASGDVSVEMASPVDGAMNIRTVSGDINIEVPDGSNARVSLSAVRGDVTCSLPINNESKARTTLTGQLGDGKGSIDASAINGDVSLGLRDSAAG